MGRRLDGKVAIVTGGAMGQGAGICRGLRGRGRAVVVADVAKDEGQALADELGESARTSPTTTSATPASWTALVEDTDARFGPVNVLANNAGILRFGDVERMPLDEVELLWRVNQLGCFLGMQAVVPDHAQERRRLDHQRLLGRGPRPAWPAASAYAATKLAIRGMTKCAAHGARAATTSASTRCTPA